MTLLVGLALLGLAAGVGITAIGPGGVLATIGLFALTDLTPPQVAGTALVTHIATGVLATAAYARSGHLQPLRTAGILAATAVVGAPLGVLANSLLSSGQFGILLALFTAAIATLVWYRDRRPHPDADGTGYHPSVWTIAVLGLVVAAASGLFGVGGPLLTVPILVALGVPVLPSLAVAQVQSVFIAGVGSLGYLATGAIDWPLAAVVGIPELTGVLLGWKIARALPARTLKYTLIATLLALTPYLALHG